MKNRYFLVIITVAVSIKLVLFVFALANAPGSKIMNDTDMYMKTASALASTGTFGVEQADGTIKYDTLRTPGYPLFLAVLHYRLGIPLDGIVFLQIILAVAAAFITYKTAVMIDPRIGLLSLAIMLFDPPVTIYSQMILTEILFLFLISVFMFEFTLYLKKRRLRDLIFSALILASGVYVRPIAYYLGIALTVFLIYANRRQGLKKIFGHCLIFLVIVYGLIGAWQARNYMRSGKADFTTVQNHTVTRRLVGSYSRNTDPATRGMAPLPYYANVTSRCLLSIMTRPGNLKFFRSEALTAAGLVLAYPWMVFWLTGFVAGISRIKNNVYLQFMFFVVLYFVTVSVVALMWLVGDRFRVPMAPFIAVISAYGWTAIWPLLRRRLVVLSGVGRKKMKEDGYGDTR